MPNNDPQMPLEGKGEEMVPDRGMPFDSDDDSPAKDGFTDEEGLTDFLKEGALPPEASAPPQEKDQDPFARADEAEALSANVDKSFEMEASPWHGGDDEAQPFFGDENVEAFPSSDASDMPFGTAVALPPAAHPDAPPSDSPDEGMTTHREESAQDGDPQKEDGGMAAAYPPETSASLPQDEVAQPRPESMNGAPIFSARAFIEPGPNTEEIRKTIEDDHGHDADEGITDLLVSNQMLQALWARADQAQQDVNQYITSAPLAQTLLDYIQTARNELMGGRENYEEAERNVNEVAFRVALNQKMTQWSKSFIPWLYAYEFIWAVVLLIILGVFLGEAAFDASKTEGVSDLTYLFGTMVWGGLGGVIGALLSLVKHISQDQDFDKQHAWWYYSSPPMGIGIGAVVFLFMRAGLLSIAGSGGDISSPIIIYILAWLTGYQHNVFTDLVKRMLKIFSASDDSDKKEDEKKKEEETLTENS